ncbi:MAG: histidinol-phosphate transaminase [Deinococcus sp.]|uniref:pyridoxal phosphate-dependent aminotransferase n=1 Tax=Deinococcus sp. TaxID=47478 RepID=UPI0026DD2F56|nr:histidinol-phosphate transaminase [Deinococcus sp.]MDO4244843.1 histidinol-phosphate transaminase [Deinococcus sp.]
MTSAPTQRSGVRQAVRDIPAYPFTPVNVPYKLDQNENPYDFPAELKQKAAERLLAHPWNRYPDLHADTLRSAIARFEDWDAAGVVITPGSNVLIKILTELAGIGQTVLTTDPTFAVYTLEAQMLGAKLVLTPLNPDFSLPVEATLEALDAHEPGVLYVTQPHAPTGHSDRPEDVRRVVEAADARGWVTVIDEAYYQYAGTDYRDLVRAGQNVLSLRTFSKGWGLAGVRAGYLLTNTALAGELQKLVSAFTINFLTQAVIETALEHPEYMRGRVAEAVAERQRIFEATRNHPTCQVLPSSTNFFLLKTPDADAAYQHLLSHGIACRRQDKLRGLEGCLRISVGKPHENDALIAAINSL